MRVAPVALCRQERFIQMIQVSAKVLMVMEVP